MDGQRWAQIEKLIHAALQLPAGERDAFVAEHCSGDDELRQQVHSLLKPPQLPVEESLTDTMLVTGAAVGPYQIEGPLGKGGMGEVFLAYDSIGLRNVALKRLRMDNDLSEHRRAQSVLPGPQ